MNNTTESNQETHSHSGSGIFTSLLHQPKNVHFANQEENEKIIILFRRHFAKNIPWLLITFLLLLLAPLITAFSDYFQIIPPLPSSYRLVLVLFYYLLIMSYVLLNFFSWFYNLGIITTSRIVEIESPNILSQRVATVYLSDIVDVKYTQRGILQNTFNFGNVDVQTEGLKANFEFTAISQPALITDIILDIKAGRTTHV